MYSSPTPKLWNAIVGATSVAVEEGKCDNFDPVEGNANGCRYIQKSFRLAQEMRANGKAFPGPRCRNGAYSRSIVQSQGGVTPIE